MLLSLEGAIIPRLGQAFDPREMDLVWTVSSIWGDDREIEAERQKEFELEAAICRHGRTVSVGPHVGDEDAPSPRTWVEIVACSTAVRPRDTQFTYWTHWLWDGPGSGMFESPCVKITDYFVQELGEGLH